MVSKPSTATNVFGELAEPIRGSYVQLPGDSKVLNIVSNAMTIQNEAALQVPQGLL
jgi:hypothetical protein